MLYVCFLFASSRKRGKLCTRILVCWAGCRSATAVRDGRWVSAGGPQQPAVGAAGSKSLATTTTAGVTGVSWQGGRGPAAAGASASQYSAGGATAAALQRSSSQSHGNAMSSASPGHSKPLSTTGMGASSGSGISSKSQLTGCSAGAVTSNSVQHQGTPAAAASASFNPQIKYATLVDSFE